MFNKKKIIAFSMLLLVAAPIFYFAGFIIVQRLIQHEMEEKLENTFLQTIIIDKGEIQWLKRNKEAIVKGRLFDIKAVAISGNKIILTGLYDEEEKKLKDTFVNIMHRKKNNSIPANYFIIKLIFSSISSQDPNLIIEYFSQKNKTMYYCYAEVIVSRFLSLITPPPNV